MSREERKMAQIIASIERMEQRKAATPSSASSRGDSNAESDGNASSGNTGTTATQEHRPKMERLNSSEIHTQVQKSTRLGAKGKKLKPLSTLHGGKVRSGGKKAKTPQDMVVNKREIVDCKLTPKKRWIQLWIEQLSTSDESADGSEKKAEQQEQEPEKEPSREATHLPSKADAVEAKSAETVKPTRPTIAPEESVKEEGEEDEDDEDEEGAVKVSEDEKAVAPRSPQAGEQKEASISPVSSVKEASEDSAAALQEKKDERKRSAASTQSSRSAPSSDSRRAASKNKKASKKGDASAGGGDSDDTKKPHAGKSASAAPSAGESDANLRVKTPQVVESSHLSPPLDRNSPAAAASISPSAKAKDAEPSSADSPPLEESAPSSSSSDQLSSEAKMSPSSPIPRRDMSEVINKPRDGSRKRSLERKESEHLTDEERRRAERRRNRKSNWDVGDPRFARTSDKLVRSPLSDDGNSSLSKFPPGRPSWRHSNSMDTTYSSKSSFQNNSGINNLHRGSSFSGGSSGPTRRGFYSSASLPLDRSRSAGRSSSRYNQSNSSSNGYR